MDVHTYTTMISLCGPWQQLPRALQLVNEMRTRSDEAGVQVSPGPGRFRSGLGSRFGAGKACMQQQGPHLLQRVLTSLFYINRD